MKAPTKPLRTIGFCAGFYLALCIGLLGQIPLSAQAEPKRLTPISDEFQDRLIQLYSESNCGKIQELVETAEIDRLRSNVLALVAYCDPKGHDPEELFRLAEERNPTGDLILVLHAKWKWKRDPKSSSALWEKVLLTARNPYFVDLAKDYLNNQVTSDKPINLSPYTIFGSVALGVSHEQDPRDPDFPYLHSQKSDAENFLGEVSLSRWVPWGSLSGKYRLRYNHYFSDTPLDLQEHWLELGAAMHVGAHEDLVFRPIVSHVMMGNAPLRSTFGLGMKGIVYRPGYRQFVQGLIFDERDYPRALAGQSAAHYRFEYGWEIFPLFWTIQTFLYVEHASGSNSQMYNGLPGDYNNSHTDVAFQGRVTREFGWISGALATKVKTRVDSYDSSYTPAGSAKITKQRRDLDLMLHPEVGFPLGPTLQLWAWYEWRQVFSNVGATDYANRNFVNHSLGLSLRAFMSTY